MEEIKLPDSEMKVMGFLWERNQALAKEVAQYMEQTYGWKKNTTYTVLKNLHEKGAIERTEPGFLCIPRIHREEVGKSQAKTLLERFYKGSAVTMFSSFLDDKMISPKELEEIRNLLNKE